MFFSVRILEGWQPPEHLLTRHDKGMNPSLRQALACQGSLTRHMEHLWLQPVGVRLEGQSAMSGFLEDAILWNGAYQFPVRGLVLHRDAWITVGGRDRVFAHSQLAVADLPKEMRRSIDAGDRPLGAIFLEQEQTVVRESLELALTLVPEVARKQGLPDQSPFWCRRSLLRVNGQRQARIMELFLPSFA